MRTSRLLVACALAVGCCGWLPAVSVADSSFADSLVYAVHVYEDERGEFEEMCTGVPHNDPGNILGQPDCSPGNDVCFLSLGYELGNFVSVDVGDVFETCGLLLHQVGTGSGPGAELEAFSVLVSTDGSSFDLVAAYPDQTGGEVLDVPIPTQDVRYVRIRQDIDDPLQSCDTVGADFDAVALRVVCTSTAVGASTWGVIKRTFE